MKLGSVCDPIEGVLGSLCADAAPVEVKLGESVLASQLSAADWGELRDVCDGPCNLGWMSIVFNHEIIRDGVVFVQHPSVGRALNSGFESIQGDRGLTAASTVIGKQRRPVLGTSFTLVTPWRCRRRGSCRSESKQLSKNENLLDTNDRKWRLLNRTRKLN